MDDTHPQTGYYSQQPTLTHRNHPGNLMRKLLITALAGTLLAACSSTNQDSRRVQFICDDNSEITVDFDIASATVRRADGKGFVLPQEIAASGFWYRSGRYELRGKGNDVTWSEDARRPRQCTVKTGA